MPKKTKEQLAKLLIPHIDLTNLDDAASVADIDKLCQHASTPLGSVAAVCVYPKFVAQCKKQLPKKIKLATVVNFPKGTSSLNETCELIEAAIKDGADEIDLVLPYPLFLAGDRQEVETYIMVCKKRTNQHAKLKVILETGALKSPEAIAQASQIALSAGADFLKTSTGKIPTGATLEAAEAMLSTIKDSGAKAGLKVSGGVKTAEQAQQYYDLTKKLLGKRKLTSSDFRIGASRLLDELVG